MKRISIKDIPSLPSYLVMTSGMGWIADFCYCKSKFKQMERPKIELANYFIMHFNIFSIFRLHKKFEPSLTPTVVIKMARMWHVRLDRRVLKETVALAVGVCTPVWVISATSRYVAGTPGAPDLLCTWLTACTYAVSVC